MDLENSTVIGAADEYERQNDQEFPHKRRARLRMEMGQFGFVPSIEFVEPKQTVHAAILGDLGSIQTSLNNLQTIIRDNSHLLGGDE